MFCFLPKLRCSYWSCFISYRDFTILIDLVLYLTKHLGKIDQILQTKKVFRIQFYICLMPSNFKDWAFLQFKGVCRVDISINKLNQKIRNKLQNSILLMPSNFKKGWWYYALRLSCTLAAVMASHSLQLNFSIVNYFLFISLWAHSYIRSRLYKINIIHHSKWNHFKI